MEWNTAQDVKKDIAHIVKTLDLSHIDLSRVFCYRTQGSKSRAYARTWSFPKIFQRALTQPPAYVIEVLTRYYDRLDDDTKKKVLIHELLHIPKNFSGALLPHRSNGRHIGHMTSKLFKEYKQKTNY